MDYLHLSTADVAILKGSWLVLEEHVTRVGVDFFLDLIYNHEEMKLGTVCQSTQIIVYSCCPVRYWTLEDILSLKF